MSGGSLISVDGHARAGRDRLQDRHHTLLCDGDAAARVVLDADAVFAVAFLRDRLREQRLLDLILRDDVLVQLVVRIVCDDRNQRGDREMIAAFQMLCGVFAEDYNENHDPANGQFTSGPKSGTIKDDPEEKTVVSEFDKPHEKKPRYAPSPQRSFEGVQLEAKEYSRVAGMLNTRFPGLDSGEIRTITTLNRIYIVKADGYGGFVALHVFDT